MSLQEVRGVTWLTAAAITKCGPATFRAEQDAYMAELLPYLDSSEHVFRYAWALPVMYHMNKMVGAICRHTIAIVDTNIHR